MNSVVLLDREIEMRSKAPAYEINFEPAPKQVKVVFAGTVVAKSDRAMILRETRLAPVYYIPTDDVDASYLEPSDHNTYCPFKGTAVYWDLVVGERRSENAVWSYRNPQPEAKAIGGYMAFYSNRVDAFCEADREVSIDPGEDQDVGANPLVNWLVREAWEAVEARELTARFARRMLESDIPIARLNVLLGTLNPMVAGTAYVWKAEDGVVQVLRLLHERRNSSAFLESPLIPIYEGRGGIRRRLEEPGAQIDFPILKELQKEGVTDYVALPMHFSDGHINALTLATDQPGGFTTAHLGQVYEALPLLTRLFEVHALKRTTKSLMATYLGARTADLILGGKIQRGDGESVPAVIFYADLRDSTALAVQLGRMDYMKCLNAFFEAVAGQVMKEGGEVLKFIGDAVLAIFPITDSGAGISNACQSAFDAAHGALQQIKGLELEDGLPRSLEAGIALHKGDVTYGNVGARKRLDFTVVGRAANEVARIAELCKSLQEPLLISGAVAPYLDFEMTSLGRHKLRGTEKSHEIFTILREP